jgi:hypothetical protein
LNPSLSLDKKLSICCVNKPVFWEPRFKLRERWEPPIGNGKYFLAQFPLSIVSQVLIIKNVEIELVIKINNQENTPYIIAISPYLETDFKLTSVISSNNSNSNSSITLGGGAIGNTGISLPLRLMPDITGVIKAENNKAVWFISPGHLWRIFNSSRIKGLYSLKTIFAMPSGISEITSKLYVRVCAQEWQKKKVYYFYNEFIFTNILDHSCL